MVEENKRKSTDSWVFEVCGACLDDRHHHGKDNDFCQCCNHEEVD